VKGILLAETGDAPEGSLYFALLQYCMEDSGVTRQPYLMHANGSLAIALTGDKLL